MQFDKANTQVEGSVSRVGVLHLPKRYQSAYIIDGQHRLSGVVVAYERQFVAVERGRYALDVRSVGDVP